MQDCIRWGVNYKTITYAEYKKLLIKNLHKRAEEEALTRKLYSAILNFGGMGRKEFINEEKIWSIPIIDYKSVNIPISSKRQALDLLKELIK